MNAEWSYSVFEQDESGEPLPWWLIILLAVVFGLIADHEAKASMTERCQADNTFIPSQPFECYTTVTERVQVLGQNWQSYTARWVAPSGRNFLALGRGCRSYGRYAGVHVAENFCGGNLIVHASAPARFEWEVN